VDRQRARSQDEIEEPPSESLRQLDNVENRVDMGHIAQNFGHPEDQAGIQRTLQRLQASSTQTRADVQSAQDDLVTNDTRQYGFGRAAVTSTTLDEIAQQQEIILEQGREPTMLDPGLPSGPGPYGRAGTPASLADTADLDVGGASLARRSRARIVESTDVGEDLQGSRMTEGMRGLQYGLELASLVCTLILPDPTLLTLLLGR